MKCTGARPQHSMYMQQQESSANAYGGNAFGSGPLSLPHSLVQQQGQDGGSVALGAAVPVEGGNMSLSTGVRVLINSH